MLLIIARLVKDGAILRAYDPESMGAGPLLPVAVEYCASALGAAHGADALALVTEWNEFRAVPPAKLGRGNAWSRGDGPGQRL